MDSPPAQGVYTATGPPGPDGEGQMGVDHSGGSTRAGRAQAGNVIMSADTALLAGLAAPVTLVSWRSHRVKRVVARGDCTG